MRWRREVRRAGEIRHVRRWLWWPEENPHDRTDVRWMEWVDEAQQWIEFGVISRWHPIGWDGEVREMPKWRTRDPTAGAR